MSARSLYELLGSRPEASAAELRFDYERALASANRSGAMKRMVELVDAYEVLSNPHYRAYYDRTGRAVRQERVPNTYGRPVPFRSGGPSIMSVLPASPVRCGGPEAAFSLVTRRGRTVALLLLPIIVLVAVIATELGAR